MGAHRRWLPHIIDGHRGLGRLRESVLEAVEAPFRCPAPERSLEFRATVPPALGPYSPVVRAGPWLVCSGQLGVAPDGSGAPRLVDGPTAQLAQALENADELLTSEGASRTDVVKTTVFVTDLGQAGALNEAYVGFFGDHRPARSMVGVAALPLGALVEVELWAYREPPSAG